MSLLTTLNQPNPLPIPNLGLRFFWDAVSVTGQADGTALAQLTDMSGSGKSATQATSTSQGVWRATGLNGKPAVELDGGDDLYSFSGTGLNITQNARALTVVVVSADASDLSTTAERVQVYFSRNGTNGARSQLFHVASATTGGPLDVAMGGRRLEADTYAQARGGLAVAQPRVETGVLDYYNATARHYSNGVEDGSLSPFQTAGQVDDLSSLSAAVGANTALNRFWRGLISFVAVYDRVLTDAELQQVHNYARNTYLPISPTGIATSEVAGNATVTPGDITLSPAGVSTAEAVGSPTVAREPARLSDRFDATDTTKWAYAADAAVSGGNLVLTHGPYNRTGSKSTWDVAGTVNRIGPINYNTTAGNEFYWLYGTPGGAFDADTTQLQFIIAGGTLIARSKVGGTASADSSVAWTNNNWLQFRESGGTVYFETAASEADLDSRSGTYVLVRSLANPFALTGRTWQVMAGNNTANTTVTTIGGMNPSLPPGAPAWLTTVGADSTTMQVSWGPTGGVVTGFQLERDGEVTPIALGTASSVYLHTGLTADSQHSYRVRSTDGTNFSAWVSAPAARTMPERTGTQLAIPTYYFPPFNLDPAPAGTIAVANPASGPGTAAQTAYTNEITTQQNAGRKVIGYVSTAYGNRAVADVKADIDRWYSFYPAINGIFLDEQANTAGLVAHYVDLYNYIKGKQTAATVVGNPGQSTIEEYTSTADIIMTFENTGANHATHTNPAWMANYSKYRFWDAVHAVASTADMQAVVTKVKSTARNVGWTYVTDDVLPNPWDVLATYWASEVSTVTSPPQTLSPTGVGTAEAVGAAIVQPGGVTLSPAGASSAELLGTATLTAGAVTLSPSSVMSVEASGTPAVLIAPAESGSLRTLLETYPVLASGTAGYLTPTASDLTAFRGIWSNIQAGNVGQAHADAAAFNYEVIDFTDTETVRKFYVLREKATKDRWWGIYVWSRETGRTNRIVAAAHSSADANTELQGADFLLRNNARAALFTGTHRNASATLDGDGDNITDVANASDPPSSIFQAVFETTADGTTTTVEPHGFGASTSPPMGSAHWIGPYSGADDTTSGRGKRIVTYNTAVAGSVSRAIQLPEDSKPGDTVLWFQVIRDVTATVTDPAGWAIVAPETTDGSPGIKTRLLSRVLDATDFDANGAPIFYTSTWSIGTKGHQIMVAYESAGIVDAASSANEPGTTVTTHSTGSVTTTVADTVLVAFYAVTNTSAWDPGTATQADRRIVQAATTATDSSSAAVFDTEGFTRPVGTYTASAVNPTGSSLGGFFLVALRPKTTVRATEIIVSGGALPQHASVQALVDDYTAAGFAAVNNDGSWPLLAAGNVQGVYQRAQTGGRFLHVEQAAAVRTDAARRSASTGVMVNFESAAAKSLSPGGVPSAEQAGAPTLTTTALLSPTAVGSAEQVGSSAVSVGEVTLAAAGVGSGEAVSAPALSTSVSVSPGSIGSAEAVGSSSVQPGEITLGVIGVSSAEQIGTVALSFTLNATGVASAETVGAPTVQAGAVNLAPAGVASAEQSGTPVVSAGATSIAASGIGSAEQVGSSSVGAGEVTLSPAAVGSTEAAGFPTATSTVTLAPAAVPTGEATGAPVLAVGAVSLAPAAVVSAEQAGAPTVEVAGVVLLAPSSISSSEAFGAATVSPGAVTVTAAAAESAEAYGAPSLTSVVTLTATGVPSAEAHGTPIVQATNTLSPAGIASTEGPGSPSLTVGAVQVSPTGALSAEAPGSATLTASFGISAAGGVPSADAPGAPQVLAGGVDLGPSGVGSSEAVGGAALQSGGVSLAVSSVSTTELVGLASVQSFYTLSVLGVPGAETFGVPTVEKITLPPVYRRGTATLILPPAGGATLIVPQTGSATVDAQQTGSAAVAVPQTGSALVAAQQTGLATVNAQPAGTAAVVAPAPGTVKVDTAPAASAILVQE